MSDDLVLFPVKLTKTDHEELKRVAKAEKVPASDIVRALLSQYMQERSEKFSGEVPQHGGRRTRTA